MPDGLESEATLDLMIAEAIKTSEIEGELLVRRDVVSSIRNHLGLNSPAEPVGSRAADGAAALMVAVRRTYAEPLTETTLCDWHALLLQSARGIMIGDWRTGDDPMQVVSGRIDRPTVHFEAPPADRVPGEMARFVDWFNESARDGAKPITHAPVRSAISHLYFESIHPFEDGNGRIGRAVSEKALSQGLGQPVLLSLSQTIEANRNAYYDALQTAQRGNEITPWITYFVDTVLQAQHEAVEQIAFLVRKAKFFQRHRTSLNPRQAKVIRRMFDAGPNGFQGGMNASKYVSLTQVSKATATRDLQALLRMGALEAIGGGRSTRYQLNF